MRLIWFLKKVGAITTPDETIEKYLQIQDTKKKESARKLKSMTIKRRKQKEKPKPSEIIIAALYLFYKQGKKETSLYEIHKSIGEFQKKYPLSYRFSDFLFYSDNLLSDLRDLEFEGYLHKYNLRYDAFLPKTYIALTFLGRGHGNKFVEKIPDNPLRELEKAVIEAIKDYKNRWRLYGRRSAPKY